MDERRRVSYRPLDSLEPQRFLALLNSSKVRRHLINHHAFDESAVREWVSGKVALDAMPGCRLRAVCLDGSVAGWCGVQPDDDGFELAVVLDDRYWGIGREVFATLMVWARELGHDAVNVHLLASRPEYRFLRKMALSVSRGEWLGESFVSYRLAVPSKPGLGKLRPGTVTGSE